MNVASWIVFVIMALFAALDWRALIINAWRGVLRPGSVFWVALWTGGAIVMLFAGRDR